MPPLRRPLLAAALALTCATTSGCYTLSAHTEGVNPVLINQPKPGGHYFTREERVHYLFWGLFPLNSEAVPIMLKSYQVGNVRSVTVQMEMDVWGIVGTILTYGIYSNKVVRVEGASD